MADADVVHLVDRRALVRREPREQVRLHDVLDVAEVAAGLAVAEDDALLVGEQPGDPARDHRRVGTLRILTRPEDVEVAQPDHLEPVELGEAARVQLVDALGERVGRARVSQPRLHLGAPRLIAVHRARRRIDEAPDAGVAGSDQQIQRAVDVHLVAADGVLDRSRHRAQPRLVQHYVDAGAGAAAFGRIAHVALDHAEVARRIRPRRGERLGDVLAESGLVVVEADHLLSERDQVFDQVAADEARRAGDQPGPRLQKLPLRLFEELHQRLQYWMPRSIASAGTAALTSMKIPPLRMHPSSRCGGMAR